ncbi:MAG: GDP-L-fucose synthase [Legionella sp.]|uniref:GDP-L-fucose synthase family protein n=1 Tax=Legionella sp. TaxID=459 RepID=UPI0039E6CE79
MTTTNKITKQSKIYVAGHNGMLGSAIVRRLKQVGYTKIITKSRSELDLAIQSLVHDFFQTEQPDYVFLAAAKVGGIHANRTYRADFIYQNLMIETNIIHAAKEAGVQRLLFLGSSCIYPRDCPQPIKEEYLLTGPLETTNESYALAKIAGIKLCESYNQQYNLQYISAMPANLYGPNDHYDLENSHVLPALIRKTYEAKLKNEQKLIVWGSGKSMREFLYVDDMAEACVFLMESSGTEGLYNVGTGQDITIYQLAELIMQVIGFSGKIIFDPTKPDGTLRKVLDINKMRQLGWEAKTALIEGIAKTYDDFLTNTRM